MESLKQSKKRKDRENAEDGDAMDVDQEMQIEGDAQ